MNTTISIVSIKTCSKKVNEWARRFDILLTSAHPVGSDCGIWELAWLVSVMHAIKMAMSLSRHRWLYHLRGHRSSANPCPIAFQCLRMVWTVRVVLLNLASHRIPIDRLLDDTVHQASCDQLRSFCVWLRVVLRHVFSVRHPEKWQRKRKKNSFLFCMSQLVKNVTENIFIAWQRHKLISIE